MASTWAATSPCALQVVASGLARGVVSAIAYHTADILMSEVHRTAMVDTHIVHCRLLIVVAIFCSMSLQEPMGVALGVTLGI
eukprot:716177-Karenia_brevis.AAC.1